MWSSPRRLNPPRFLFAFLWILLTACSDPEFTRDRTFDFLAHLGRAEILSSGGPVDPARFMGYVQPWTPEESLFCPAPRRTSIRFQNVPLNPGGKLDLGFGLRPGSKQPRGDESGRILLRVEVMEGRRRHEIWERSLDPQLLEPGRIIREMVPLPRFEGSEGSFIFHSDMSLDLSHLKPVWCGPRLLSQGRRIPRKDAMVVFPSAWGMVLDMPSPEDRQGEGKHFRADFDEEEKVFLPTPTGRLLLQVPPSSTVFNVEIPDRAHLALGISVSGSLGKSYPDVLFQALLDGREVFREIRSGEGKGRSRRIKIPLESMAGKKTCLELRSSYMGPSPGENDDSVAVWIYPVIEKEIPMPRQPKGQGKNVILMVVDALRADHTSLHGYERNTTPHLERIARDGTVFENAWAQSSWTIPSTATLLTGQYSYTHGLYDAYHWYLVPGIRTLGTAFLRSGVTTAAFVANHLISEDNNFTEGFETFVEAPFSSAAQMNRAFLNWLDNHGDERFFAYLHYMEPHLPYAAPGEALTRYRPVEAASDPDPNRSGKLKRSLEDHLKIIGPSPANPGEELPPRQQAFLEELIDLYDGEIAYWDERFALFMEELGRRDLLENSIVIITSDHGEEFLDHGQLTHGQNLHPELLHIPLIILNSNHPPGVRPDLVGLIDLAPTLLNLAGVERVEGFGRNPSFAGFDLFDRPPDRKHLFAETAHGLLFPGSDMGVQQAVFSSDWKGILTRDNGHLALFDRRLDGEEKNDLSPSHPEQADHFNTLISNWVKECRSTAPFQISLLDEGALEKLREMGYVK